MSIRLFLILILTLLSQIRIFAQVREIVECVTPSEMSTDDCKNRLVCCGDSLAYDNLLRYTHEEFDLGKQVYYRLLMACKYPELPHTYSNVESILIYLLHRDIHSCVYMDQITRRCLYLLLREGVQQGDGEAAYGLSRFYTYIESDSLEALKNRKVYLEYGGVHRSKEYVAEKLRLFSIEWTIGQRRKYPIRAPKPVLPQDTTSLLNKLRYQVRLHGDTASYARLIMISKEDTNHMTFNECLFEAILMYNRYLYMPAREHVVQILNSFYENDEIPSSLFIQIKNLYNDIKLSPKFSHNNITNVVMSTRTLSRRPRIQHGHNMLILAAKDVGDT